MINNYKQDSICGTWEVLANAVYPGGLKRIKKQPYGEIGKMKSEWADKIGSCMNFDRNASPSFNAFLNEIRVRIQRTA